MKIVAFDLDDTLVAEVLFLKSGIRHIAKELHLKHPGLSEFRITACMDAAVATRRNHYSALEEYLAREGMLAEVDMRETVASFRNHLPDTDIYHLSPSRFRVLSQLKESHDTILALITDGRSTTQRNKIAAAGLLSFFDSGNIYISEETGHDKKDPDNFLALMRKYAGVTEFHYVGDNPEKDVGQPSRLGWSTHLVRPFPLAVHQGMPR